MNAFSIEKLRFEVNPDEVSELTAILAGALQVCQRASKGLEQQARQDAKHVILEGREREKSKEDGA